MHAKSVIEAARIDTIFVAGARRALDEPAVERMMQSITEIGMQTPITVRLVKEYVDPDTGPFDNAHVLVTGRHRLEACRRLGRTHIECFVEEWDEDTARMWEISENLQRADLSELERLEQIAEYAELAANKREKSKSAQVAQSTRWEKQERGNSAASRDLRVSRDEVRRAGAVAGIDDAAKTAAVAAKIDDNQAALLRIAKQKTPTAQLAAVKAEEERKANAKRDRAIAYAEAQELAEWLHERLDLDEVDYLASRLSRRVKVKDLIDALGRQAA